MSNNTFWILILLFFTPFGWIGLMCISCVIISIGSSIGYILQGFRGKLNIDHKKEDKKIEE